MRSENRKISGKVILHDVLSNGRLSAVCWQDCSFFARLAFVRWAIRDFVLNVLLLEGKRKFYLGFRTTIGVAQVLEIYIDQPATLAQFKNY
jgi:hypothetical protein